MSRLSANFIFCLFYLSNFLLFGCGIGIAVLGIYIWSETKRAGEFEIIFLILGIIVFLIAILGCYSRKSTGRLSCYSCSLSVIFVIQLVCSILGIAFKSKVIDMAAEHINDPNGAQHFKDMISNNVDIAFYCTLVVDVVEVYIHWCFSLYLNLIIVSVSHTYAYLQMPIEGTQRE